jgi:hypothetical protein
MNEGRERGPERAHAQAEDEPARPLPPQDERDAQQQPAVVEPEAVGPEEADVLPGPRNHHRDLAQRRARDEQAEGESQGLDARQPACADSAPQRERGGQARQGNERHGDGDDRHHRGARPRRFEPHQVEEEARVQPEQGQHPRRARHREGHGQRAELLGGKGPGQERNLDEASGLDDDLQGQDEGASLKQARIRRRRQRSR